MSFPQTSYYLGKHFFAVRFPPKAVVYTLHDRSPIFPYHPVPIAF